MDWSLRILGNVDLVPNSSTVAAVIFVCGRGMIAIQVGEVAGLWLDNRECNECTAIELVFELVDLTVELGQEFFWGTFVEYEVERSWRHFTVG